MKRWTLLLLLTLPVGARPLPYQEAGLNSYQAAAHLLSRFTYGARPGEVQAVVHEGLDVWLDRQLSLKDPDPVCEARLRAYPALAMNLEQQREHYIGGPELRRMAKEAGLSEEDKKLARREVMQMVAAEGLETERDLFRELLAQKATRALYSQHQVQEVMTDFWFNHFNVSRTNNPARPFLLSYERDVVRPGALGDFRSLLGHTARHPAMLFYLNNAQSVANADAPRLAQPPFRWGGGRRQLGLNENYARELMELHTLGVDGGYTQKDVTEVARILTGWTTLPRGGQAARFERLLEQFPNSVSSGANGFLFVPFLHDAGPKTVLGSSFPAGHGMDEGERLLDLLAQHPRCSERIARKFAVRFVSDDPDPQLVRDLALTFRRSHGNSSAMIRALVGSPQFWAPAALRAKVKNPAEYTFSCIRALGGEMQMRETDVPKWLDKMGQTPYGCVPPTGYPDTAEQWINSGTLVTRMNFAFALVSNHIRGLHVQVPDAPVEELAARLLPGRDLKQALGPVRQTLSNHQFFSTLKADDAPLKLSQSQKAAGVLVSCPEFQRR